MTYVYIIYFFMWNVYWSHTFNLNELQKLHVIDLLYAALLYGNGHGDSDKDTKVTGIEK